MISLEQIILNGITEEVEKIIERVKEEEALANNTSAVNVLINVNRAIKAWMMNASDLVNIDDEKIEATIKKAKEEVTRAAKEEVGNEIANIVVQGKGNVTEKVAEYLANLKSQGIELDEVEQEEIHEERKDANKKLVRNLLSTPTSEYSSRKSERACQDSSGCGGGSTGCGGGC